ncbi:unnamed protein product [Triticum turgidum subsp. durum]|uniref:Uncharacterized protein n=1 Tax=Triticum turgidum subsp. durum TaxID=4567 RepID=A0A9R1NTZ2_TRITD|nr:unnamed protein product [Triticum turgidum subsp. durum]
MNLVTYLRGTMHMGVAEASTTASNFFAALQMFSIPAAFLADSYIKRFYTVLIFGPIEILVASKGAGFFHEALDKGGMGAIGASTGAEKGGATRRSKWHTQHRWGRHNGGVVGALVGP